jgi:hypothetical protein
VHITLHWPPFVSLFVYSKSRVKFVYSCNRLEHTKILCRILELSRHQKTRLHFSPLFFFTRIIWLLVVNIQRPVFPLWNSCRGQRLLLSNQQCMKLVVVNCPCRCLLITLPVYDGNKLVPLLRRQQDSYGVGAAWLLLTERKPCCGCNIAKHVMVRPHFKFVIFSKTVLGLRIVPLEKQIVPQTVGCGKAKFLTSGFTVFDHLCCVNWFWLMHVTKV